MELNLSTRETLIASLPHNGICAEIGVEYGFFSKKIWALNEPKLLVLVDLWDNQPKEVYGNDLANGSTEFKNGQYEEVVERFKGYDNVKIIKGMSQEVARAFANNYFDWIHIDANHLQAVADIQAWWPTVRSGGWITGHDYTMCGDYITVKDDVDNFVREKGLKLFVTTGEGGDVFEKNYPTWCFRKP